MNDAKAVNTAFNALVNVKKNKVLITGINQILVC